MARPIPDHHMPEQPGIKRLRLTDPAAIFSVRVVLRRRPGAPPLPDARHWMRVPPGRRQFLSAALLREHFGASTEDAAVVRAYLTEMGLEVRAVDLAARAIEATGPVRAMAGAFRVEFHDFEDHRTPRDPAQSPDHEIHVFRGFLGRVTLPDRVADAVVSVLGLSSQRVGGHNAPGSGPITPAADLTVEKIRDLYNFPATGAPDVHLGILVVDDGTDRTSIENNVTAYFAQINAARASASMPALTPPALTPESDHFALSPSGGSSSASVHETTLDLCVASTVTATAGSNAHVKVYQSLSGSTTRRAAWDAGLTAIAADSPDVLSISSYLLPDDQITTEGDLATLSDRFRELAALGVTVLVASGDGGSVGQNNPASASLYPQPAVQYPASDPWVTTCGGTTVGRFGDERDTLGPVGDRYAEVAWNNSADSVAGSAIPGGASGGGVSRFFAPPPWQLDAGLDPRVPDTRAAGRGVPDIAGNADPNSGYYLYSTAAGSAIYADQTSAVAPLYAGLAAVLRQQLGWRIGILNPTLYAHHADLFNEVAEGNNHWQNWSQPQYYAAHGGWDACTGWGSLDGTKLRDTLLASAAPPARTVRIVLDRASYARPSGAATFAHALFIVLEGFAAGPLGLSAAAGASANAAQGQPLIQFSPIHADMQITARHVDWNESIPLTQAQTITFTYEVHFNGPAPFPSPGNTTLVTLHAEWSGLADTASIELVTVAEPYFADGAVSWLSADLRVFKVQGGDAAMMARFNAPDPAASPTAFIQAAVSNLRGVTPATAVDFAAFDSLPQDERASELELALVAGGQPVYNFALARVRSRATAAIPGVRVFFRCFPTMSAGTAYSDPTASTGNYRAYTAGARKIPLLGIEGDHYTTVPYFAEPRQSPGQPMTDQTDPTNVLTIPAAPAGGEVVTYFGCWLDFNQGTPCFPTTLPPAGQRDGAFTSFALQSIHDMMAGAHQCLVAEIDFAGADPIPAGATPGTSARLAQRNIAWVAGENPGADGESRRVPHTFEIRGALGHREARGHDDRHDELMLDFSRLPPRSIARVYIPSLFSDEILDLAARHQATPVLFRHDDHTVWCEARGVVYLPIPSRPVARHPALLSIDLPASITRGQAFRVVVRQLTSAPIAEREARRRPPHRRVLGAFQLDIPVEKGHALIDREERVLGALRRMARPGMPHDPWHAVLARCLDEQEARVVAIRGEPPRARPEEPPRRRD